MWRCEVGRRQPAQRPTIAQDGAFLNYPARASIILDGKAALAGDSNSRAFILPNRVTPSAVSVKR
jgi:hypothetical protein